MATTLVRKQRLPRETIIAGVGVRVWSSDSSMQALPLLIVHDGPAYAVGGACWSYSRRPLPALACRRYG